MLFFEERVKSEALFAEKGEVSIFIGNFLKARRENLRLLAMGILG